MIRFKTKVVLADREMFQKELSERAHVRYPMVSAMCTGSAKHIPVDVLDKLCRTLKCQPGDLLEYIPDEEYEKPQH